MNKKQLQDIHDYLGQQIEKIEAFQQKQKRQTLDALKRHQLSRINFTHQEKQIFDLEKRVHHLESVMQELLQHLNGLSKYNADGFTSFSDELYSELDNLETKMMEG